MADTDYDVVIAGGGMVGASLALCLHQHSGGRLRVAVVESFALPPQSADQQPQYRPSFDARSTALSYGSRKIYETLGIWPVLQRHVSDITQIHVSDRGHFGSVQMEAGQLDWPALGYVVENAWLGNVLLNRLRGETSIAFLSPASVTDVALGEGRVSLSIESEAPQQLSAQLLVIADGAESGLRQRLGIHTHIDDYHQYAFIANIATELPHGGMAFERFTEAGPMAMLPLSPDDEGLSRSALVWTFDASRFDEVNAWSDETFLAKLQEQFGYRLGRLLKVGQRASYPLKLMEAEEQVRRQMVVMGNAAHSLHPVAGQGYNLALRDADCLARQLTAALDRGQNIGDLAVLQAYIHSQRGDQWLTTAFSDRLTHIFSNRRPVLSVLRNLGLLVLDGTPGLKTRFAARAAGVVNKSGANASL